MKLKNLFYLISAFFVLTCSISANALVDVIGGLGGSAYITDDYNSDNNTENNNHKRYKGGFNLNATALLPIHIFEPIKSTYGFDPIISIVAGPRIKYEYVVGTIDTTGYTDKETFSTLQLGAEGGAKFQVFQQITLYGTVFFSYGASNTLSENITDGGAIIPDQTVNPTVTQSWQAGTDLRAFYNPSPIFGLGIGLENATGGYQYNSYAINTIVGPQTIRGGTNNYQSASLNFLVAFYL